MTKQIVPQIDIRTAPQSRGYSRKIIDVNEANTTVPRIVDVKCYKTSSRNDLKAHEVTSPYIVYEMKKQKAR